MKKKLLSGLLALTMVSGLFVVPVMAADAPNYANVLENDVLVAEHTCEASALTELTGNNGGGNAMVPVTIEEGAPDGSKYIKTGAVGNNKYNEYCFESEFSYGSNTKEDIMFSLDVRFDESGSGFCAEDKGDAKVAGAVVNRNGKLAVQKDSSNYNTSNIAIDTTAWYHIAMAGRYSASDANIDIYVWKYNGSELEYVDKIANAALRNLSASNNSGASHLNIFGNTSIDNLRVYKLNPDEIAITTAGGDSVKAGSTLLFMHTATRAGEYITTPAVTWSVYNAENTAPLEDEEISISSGGLLSASIDAVRQTVNVRATDANGVYASKEILIDAVDKSTDTYDELELSAENDADTVRAGSPITITAAAKLEGADVTPGENDLFWKVYNEGDVREINNKNITISDDGVLSVTEDAVPQKVNVKAVNYSGSVSASYSVEVLPANMNYGNEDDYPDTFVSSNACEEYISGATLKEGSWDGSGYYAVTAAYDFVGFPSDTNESVIYEADMQFANDGAGWTVYNSGKGKLGLQLSSSGTTLNAIGASNSSTALMTIDKNTWYNIQVMCATGNSSSGTSYARFIAYQYDEDGNKINPKTGEKDVPFVSSDIKLRNLDESQANHINISAGTNVDNVRSYKVSPDKLTLAVDVETVLAGFTAQASTTASRKGVDFPFLNSSLIKYEIYDADDRYPLAGNLITIDANGKITIDPLADAQDVYVRVSSVSGGMHDSKLLTIKSSDIFEITAAGFDEEYSTLQRIEVTKNFDYSDAVSFISAVYGADGAMKTIAIRGTYGDMLNLGSNRVAMNMAMPSDFSKENDTLKAFAVTTLSLNKATVTADDMTVTKTSAGLSLTDVPDFDEKSSVIILVIKSDDPTKVSVSDIAYYNQVKAEEIPEAIAMNGEYDGDYIVEIAGKVNGVLTIQKAETAISAD